MKRKSALIYLEVHVKKFKKKNNVKELCELLVTEQEKSEILYIEKKDNFEELCELLLTEQEKSEILYKVQSFRKDLTAYCKSKKISVEIKIYGSVAKETFIPGISDVDLVLYYQHSEQYLTRIIKEFLELHGIKYESFVSKFRIFLERNSNTSMDLNLVEENRLNFSQEKGREITEIPDEVMQKILETEGLRKIREIIELSTNFIKKSIKNSTGLKKFVLFIKFWGYLTPKNPEKTFKAKSMVLELLGIYTFPNCNRPSLKEKFKDFLKILSSGSDIKIVHSEYFQKYKKHEKIRKILEYKGDIIVDPGNILNVLKVDFKSLKRYAKNTLKIIEAKQDGLKLKDLLQVDSLKKIEISKVDFSYQVLEISHKMDKISYTVDGEMCYLHPSMAEFQVEPKWFQEFIEQNVIAAFAALCMCAEVDML